MSELRYDPISDEWVVVATVRARRPDSFAAPKATRAPMSCPFCTGEEHQTPPEVLAFRNGSAPNGPGWQVRAFENKYPAFRLNGSPSLCCGEKYRKLVGSGRHEVVVLSPSHDNHMALLSQEQAELVIQAFVDRYRDLEANPNLRYITVITNQGSRAGATLAHPHSQIFAVPMVPKAVRREAVKMTRHYRRTGRCLVCDLLQHEQAVNERVVLDNEHFVAYIPYASAYPFEITISPKEHSPRFGDLEGKRLTAFAQILRECSQMLRESLNDPDYNSFLHAMPVHSGYPEEAMHWDWHIRPRLTTLGGFEHATGLVINPTRPEDSAEFLRSHLQLGTMHL